MTLQSDSGSVETRKPKLFYGYIIVTAAFVIRFAWSGIFQTFGVFLKPVSTEFDWTRAMTSGAFSTLMLLAGTFTILAGKLADRYGPRILITVCGFSIGLGFLLMSQANAIWQLYLFYGLPLAIGMGGTGDAPTISTVVRWFVKRRALMTGIVLAGMGIGTMVIVPIVSRLISNQGWRTSYIVVAIITSVLIIVAAQFLKHNPAQIGQLPYGVGGSKQEAPYQGVKGFSLKEAIGTRKFWMLCGIQASSFFIMMIIGVHIVPHATDLGISLANAANILVINGGLMILGSVILATAADRVGRKPVFIISFILRTLALFWLLIAKQLWAFYLFAAIFGFFTAGARVLMFPILAELFGLKSLGVILGCINYAGIIGGAISPVLAGMMFDVTGNYQLGFLISAVISIAGLILASLLKINAPPLKQPNNKYGREIIEKL